MEELVTHIFTHSNDLPNIDYADYFHSKSLFILYEITPRTTPYMVTVSTADGEVVSHLLAVMRYRGSWMPPFLYTHCQILGMGDYAATDYPREKLLFYMIQALCKRISFWALYFEMSNMGNKMFGYRVMKQLNFFPVKWLNIRNSLHDEAPESRLSERQLKRLNRIKKMGVTSQLVETDEDFKAFYQLLHQHFKLKMKRYIPDEAFFRLFAKTEHGRLFITRYHHHVVGCSACAYSDTEAFLWYAAFRRKSFRVIHPDLMTIWNAIQYAYLHGYRHIVFLDAGLPLKRSHYRDFLLSFGGKLTSNYRWFRFNINWINHILKWIYRE
jgi:hypothetical protein